MLKSNENLIFGKIDGTANDIPYMFPPLKGFPTIFFLSAYEKFDPIQYQGDRSYKYVVPVVLVSQKYIYGFLLFFKSPHFPLSHGRSIKDWINRHSSIFLTEEERTGQVAQEDGSSGEIESFTSENFEEDVQRKQEEEVVGEEEEKEKEKKDEL